MLSFQGDILLGGGGVVMEPKVSVNSGDHLFSQLYSFCIDQVNILIRIKVENKTTEFIQAGSTDLHPTVLHWAIFWQLYLSNLTNLFFQISYKCGNTKFLTDNIWKWKSCPFNQFLNTAKSALQPKKNFMNDLNSVIFCF